MSRSLADACWLVIVPKTDDVEESLTTNDELEKDKSEYQVYVLKEMADENKLSSVSSSRGGATWTRDAELDRCIRGIALHYEKKTINLRSKSLLCERWFC